MNLIKLIVTNRTKLKAKYGAGFKQVEKLLKQLTAADSKRGLTTKVAYIDGATPSPGVNGLKNNSEREHKRVIDDLYRALAPAYIMLLGADDIIPFQELNNIIDSDDPDAVVPSDLPYACDAGYSTDISAFTGPTRVVGRLPDLQGTQTNTNYLATLIGNCIAHKPLPEKAFYKYFAVSASVWQESTRQSLRSMFGEHNGLILSPEGGAGSRYKVYSKKQLSAMTHFYNCHGDYYYNQYFGEDGTGQPIALKSENLAKKVPFGAVVAAECCFGAQLVDGRAAGSAAPGIAHHYLEMGAVAFVGSTNIAYGPADDQGLADLITQYFIKQVLKGASSGRALLEARQRFMTESGPDIDPFELKTLAQFYLLGDPSIQPAECGIAETKAVTKGGATQNSRKLLYQKGMNLAANTGVTRRLDNTDRLNMKLKLPQIKGLMLGSIVKRAGFGSKDLKATFAVDSAGMQMAPALRKAFGIGNVRYHMFMKKNPTRPGYLRALVVKESAAQILGWKVYESR